MNALNTPSPSRDASNRATRTLAQGLAIDLLLAVATAVSAAVSGGVEWTSAYWIVLALAVAKSVAVALVSYFARLYMPPAVRPTTRGVDA